MVKCVNDEQLESVFSVPLACAEAVRSAAALARTSPSYGPNETRRASEAPKLRRPRPHVSQLPKFCCSEKRSARQLLSHDARPRTFSVPLVSCFR